MLLLVILGLLLVGNWFFTGTLVFFPVNILYRLTSIGWWALAFVSILAIAWCISDD